MSNIKKQFGMIAEIKSNASRDPNRMSMLANLVELILATKNDGGILDTVLTKIAQIRTDISREPNITSELAYLLLQAYDILDDDLDPATEAVLTMIDELRKSDPERDHVPLAKFADLIELLLIIERGEPTFSYFGFLEALDDDLSADVTGTIADGTIELDVPFGTVITALIAAFTIPEAMKVMLGEIEIVSGEVAIDYTTPKTLVVIDPFTEKETSYVVTVNVLAE